MLPIRTILLFTLPFSLLTASGHKAAVDRTPSTPQVYEDTVEAPWSREALMRSVDEVDQAREKTIHTLESSVVKVLEAREKLSGDSIEPPAGTNETVQIKESIAISDIAKAAAYVETSKANAAADISKAISSVKIAKKSLHNSETGRAALEAAREHALVAIAEAVASVEVAKARATEMIIKATESVELSKTQPPKKLAHPQEALSIAKDVSAVEIARAASAVEVARAVSAVEISQSLAHIEAAKPEKGERSFHPLAKKVPLEKIKAKAAASIADSVAKVEITKANAIAQIAQDVAKVKIAEIADDMLKKNSTHKDLRHSTYPTKLIIIKP